MSWLQDLGQIGQGVETILGETGVEIPEEIDTVTDELATTTGDSTAGGQDTLENTEPTDSPPDGSEGGIVDSLGGLWEAIWQGGEAGVVDRAEDALEAGTGAAQGRLKLQEIVQKIGPLEIAVGIGLAVVLGMAIAAARSS